MSVAVPDLTSLVPDFSSVQTAVLAVAAAIVGVYVTWKGAKVVIDAVRGPDGGDEEVDEVTGSRY
jgi:hypothetical protein